MNTRETLRELKEERQRLQAKLIVLENAIKALEALNSRVIPPAVKKIKTRSTREVMTARGAEVLNILEDVPDKWFGAHELGELLRVPFTSIYGIMNRLEGRGLVRSQTDPRRWQYIDQQATLTVVT